MIIKHVALAPGSISTEECVGCGRRTLVQVTVFAITDDGVQPFAEVDRCLTCEPFEAGGDAEA